MVRIATNDAQTQLAELVRRASLGETILITESGHPVAKLGPAIETLSGAMDQEQTLEALRDIRTRARLAPGETIKSLIHEGRKF
jgi:prevent-host-death family protein